MQKPLSWRPTHVRSTHQSKPSLHRLLLPLGLLLSLCGVPPAHAVWTQHGGSFNIETDGYGKNPASAVAADGTIYIASTQQRDPATNGANGVNASKIGVAKIVSGTVSQVGSPLGFSANALGAGLPGYSGSWAPDIETIGNVPYVAWYESLGFGWGGSYERSAFVSVWDGDSWELLPGPRGNGSLTSGVNDIEVRTPKLENIGGVLYAAIVEHQNANYNTIAVFHHTTGAVGGSWVQDGSVFSVNTTAKSRIIDLELVNVDGVPHVIWSEWRASGSSIVTNNAGTVRVKKFTAGAWSDVGGALNVSGSQPVNMVSMTAPSTIPYACWQEKTATGPWQIFCKRFNGTSWVNMASGATIDVDATWHTGRVRLTHNGTNVWATWSESATGVKSRVYARLYTVGSDTWGSIEGPINFDTTNGAAKHVDPVVKSGVLYIAWSEYHFPSRTMQIYVAGNDANGSGSAPSLAQWDADGAAPTLTVGQWATLNPGGLRGDSGVGGEGFASFRSIKGTSWSMLVEQYHTYPSGGAGESQNVIYIYDFAENRWDILDLLEGDGSEDWGSSGHDEGQTVATGDGLFYGRAGLNTEMNWQSYDYDALAWRGRRLFPANEMPNTGQAACAYDSSRNDVYCLGDSNTTLWKYDLDANTYSAMPAGPSARDWACMSYDEVQDKLVVFGGQASGALKGDTWEYTIATTTWAEFTPAPAPRPLYGPYCTYDPTAKRVLLVGGNYQLPIAGGEFSLEAWTYNTAAHAWTRIADLPSDFANMSRGAYLTHDRTNNVNLALGSLSLQVYALRLSAAVSLPLGALAHDGPATPEQLSLILPVTNTAALPFTATATCRYKVTGAGSWTTGHPLHRIRPDFAQTDGINGKFTVTDAFAWPIIGLSPGTSYDVEVTVTSGGDQEVKTATFVTRTLPGTAPSVTTSVVAGSTTAQIQAVFDAMNPGAVIQIADGTYTLTNELVLNRSGTVSQPIYIRGQSRAGTILKHTTGNVVKLLAANHLIVENLTIEGSSVNSGTTAGSVGITFFDSGTPQVRITVRNVTMVGVDRGIISTGPTEELMVYDTTLTGNNVWTQDCYANGGSGTTCTPDGTLDIEQNVGWNDDGIRLAGKGNVAFNNTLRGFGDALSFCQHSSDLVTTECRGIHYYRNEILMTADDGLEGDYAHRNLSFYDNRIHNSMTFVSFDPLYSGPAVVARNISINPGRSPYKFTNQNTGHFILNNTVVKTTAMASQGLWPWLQPQNGAQRAWGFQNNIFIYKGTQDSPSRLMAFQSLTQNPIDFTHNTFYPDGKMWWTGSGGDFTSLALAFAGLSATTPVFSGSTARHTNDNISSVIDPFVTDIVFGADFRTEITTYYTPTLSPGSTPDASGVAIANITDGYTDASPDRGAVITGRATPQWGDRTTLAGPGGARSVGRGGMIGRGVLQ